MTHIKEAKDYTIQQIEVGHALNDIYRLYEYAADRKFKNNIRRDPRLCRDEYLSRSSETRIVLGLIAARNADIHPVTQQRVTEPTTGGHDGLSMYLCGFLRWKTVADLSPKLRGKKEKERMECYQELLEGKPVVDTLSEGIKMLSEYVQKLEKCTT